jgi:hypothetical protein
LNVLPHLKWMISSINSSSSFLPALQFETGADNHQWTISSRAGQGAMLAALTPVLAE